MAEGEPYGSQSERLDAAEDAFDALDADDWAEAFSAHARIGAPRDEQGAREQAGAASASDQERVWLARGTAMYEERFGHVFLICASGLSAGELLEALEDRLGNDPETEFATAADEQRKITALRMEAL